MGEKRLTSLRRAVTWQLHVRDFPNMPKGLIGIDERFCEMLKHPYFKTYSQTTNVGMVDGNVDTLRKKVTIEYVAYNAHGNDFAACFDIGMTNSLFFRDAVDEEQAKQLFHVNSFKINIDNSPTDISLMHYICVGVTKEHKDGFLYNGRVVLMPRNMDSNKNNPIELSSLKYNVAGNNEDLPYKLLDESSKAGLYVKFSDKIKVKIEYEVCVPASDISYTKRLRYPVKYFTLDYSFNNTITDMTLVGQILGTLIDQPDITTEMNDNKTRICLRTRNWLLPKNGAVIVHCKT